MKEHLGHASIQITVDTYRHLIPGANRAAVDKLDDVPTQPTATPRNRRLCQPINADGVSRLE